jgi:hypothetical protein
MTGAAYDENVDDITLTNAGSRGSERLRWGPILEEAAAIVSGCAPGVTLRQLYYRLIAVSRSPAPPKG